MKPDDAFPLKIVKLFFPDAFYDFSKTNHESKNYPDSSNMTILAKIAFFFFPDAFATE